MRFIDFFWFLLDGDKSTKQLIAEKNDSKTATYENNQTPEPVQEAIEQPFQAQYIEEYQVHEDFCGDCDHEFFE